MANQIVKDILHPENEKGVNIYPKTSLDQVEGYTEEREDINSDINKVKSDLQVNINQKVDKATLSDTPTQNSVPVRNQYGSIEIGDSEVGNNAINLRTARKNFPSWNSAVVDSVDHVCGFLTQDTLPKKIPVNKLLAKVTSPIITINALETATNGTITEDDLAILQQNKNAMILFANEYYYLADDQHTSGYLTYSHVGVENGVQWIKSITITVASLSWVKTVDNVGGSKLYIHTLATAPNQLVILSDRKETYTPTTLTADITNGHIFNIYFKSYVAEDGYNFFNVLKIGSSKIDQSYDFYILVGTEIVQKTLLVSIVDTVREV